MQSSLKAETAELCLLCSSIDFLSLLYSPPVMPWEPPEWWEEKSAISKIQLGTLRDVAKRAQACHFCNLIIETTRWKYHNVTDGGSDNGQTPGPTVATALLLTVDGEPVMVELAQSHFCGLNINPESEGYDTWPDRIPGLNAPVVKSV